MRFVLVILNAPLSDEVSQHSKRLVLSGTAEQTTVQLRLRGDTKFNWLTRAMLKGAWEATDSEPGSHLRYLNPSGTWLCRGGLSLSNKALKFVPALAGLHRTQQGCAA